jgi:hypothetical protein
MRWDGYVTQMKQIRNTQIIQASENCKEGSNWRPIGGNIVMAFEVVQPDPAAHSLLSNFSHRVI